ISFITSLCWWSRSRLIGAISHSSCSAGAMLTDYHTHTYRCGHAVGTLREYIDAAIARGIGEIGLTDHLWLYFEKPAQRNPTYAMPESEYPRHYHEMIALRDEYQGRIRVRVCVEADYIEGHEADLLSLLL